MPDNDHVVRYNLPWTAHATAWILDEQLVEDLHIGPAPMNQVEALQRDLALRRLCRGFHKMLRRQTAQIGLGGVGVFDGNDRAGQVGSRHPLSPGPDAGRLEL